jgi:hypothetical protein
MLKEQKFLQPPGESMGCLVAGFLSRVSFILRFQFQSLGLIPSSLSKLCVSASRWLRSVVVKEIVLVGQGSDRERRQIHERGNLISRGSRGSRLPAAGWNGSIQFHHDGAQGLSRPTFCHSAALRLCASAVKFWQ